MSMLQEPTFQRLTHELNDQAKSAFTRMTSIDTKPFFEESLKKESHYFSIGAFQNGTPVGLAIAKKDSKNRADFELLHVDGNVGEVGAKLLVELEREAKKQGCYIASFLFDAGSAKAVFFDEVLSANKWVKPHVYLKKYLFDIPKFYPPWYEKQQPLPKKYTEFKWEKLTPEEKEVIQHQLREGAVPEEMSPFTKEKYDHLNSLGLKHDGEVIGWMINHRIKPDTIRYSALFVQRAFKYRGVGIHLLGSSIRIQQKSNVRWAEFVLNLYHVDHNWLQFIKRRLEPYAVSVQNILRSYKEL